MTKTEKDTGRQRKTGTIPKFRNDEEAANFWETHSIADHLDELEDVTGQVKFVPAQHKKGITVRLEDEPLDQLRKEAREKGIGPSTLARMWILERLKAEKPARSG